jgi:hypothetical protein
MGKHSFVCATDIVRGSRLREEEEAEVQRDLRRRQKRRRSGRVRTPVRSLSASLGDCSISSGD